MAAVGRVRPHSPISCPGSRLCQDSHLGGCTASERCQQHLPDFSFPWDVGPGHANACENSNCPLSQCRLPKEKLRVRIFHLKGQENFGLAVKLQSAWLLQEGGVKKRVLWDTESGSSLHPARDSKQLVHFKVDALQLIFLSLTKVNWE